jgi:hypothetical protein
MNRNKISNTLLLVLIAMFLGACNNNKGRGINTGANMGAIPTTTCLLSPNGASGLCNYNYSGYSNLGFLNYQFTGIGGNGLNNNYATGFCGCGQNAFPVYNNSWGLGCIGLDRLNTNGGYNYSYSPQYLMFSWNAMNLQWVNGQSNGYYNYGGYGGYNTCQQQFSIILACDTGAQGSCGPNATCTPLSTYGSSGYVDHSPGLCVMNQNGYYTPYKTNL